jgi:hypothetical protein
MNFNHFDVVHYPCSPLHAVSQVNKTKNVNGMILRAYTRVKPASNM